jgi:aminotransferase
VKNIGIATVPGSSFYADPNRGQYQTRFCFCKKEKTLQAAIQNLKKMIYQ